MALSLPTTNKQVVLHGGAATAPFKPVPKPTVLEEEQYVAALEEIITRDFFPDLPKLRLNEELQNAARSGDMEKMREIQRQISLLPGNAGATALDPEDEPEEPPPPSITANHTLDSFQQKFTSEDDAAFSTMMDNQNEARQKKLWYKEGMEKRLLLEGKDPETFGHLLTWDYHPENALMFQPKSLPITAPLKPTEMDHTNTRFSDPWGEKNDRPKQKNPNLDNYKVVETGEIPRIDPLANRFINLDDLMDPSGTDTSGKVAIPSINGFEFVVPPTPTPVKGKTIVTWGSIEGTPVALEPLTPSSSFSLAPASGREQAAQKLADRAQASLKKKRAAQGSMTPVPLTPTRPGSIAAPQRSLASQRLLNSITNKAKGDAMLRASYTPTNRTPSGSFGSFATPTTTPATSKRQMTPSVTPTPERKKKKIKKEKQQEPTESSSSGSLNSRATRLGLTDDLL